MRGAAQFSIVFIAISCKQQNIKVREPNIKVHDQAKHNTAGN